MSLEDPFAPARGVNRVSGSPPARHRDPALDRYLEGLDLDSVDLERTDLEGLGIGLPAGPAPEGTVGPGRGLWRLVVGGGLALAALPLQATDTYQLHGQPWWLMAWVAGGMAVVGLEGAMALVGGLQRLRRQTVGPSPLMRGGWQRWALLGAGVGLGLVLALTAPQGGWGPMHGSMGWLISVVVAIAAGLILSRWLIMQGEHDRARAAKLPPRTLWVMPGWVKWATLAVLGTGAVVAWAGLGVSEGTRGDFTRTGLGFGVGLGAAIWLVNRVDEGERARRHKSGSARATLTARQKDDI